jgi:hypothetical protein
MLIIESVAMVCLFCGPQTEFDIPAGHAQKTILQWARQAHLQVLFNALLIEEFDTLQVSGKLEPLEALHRMLRLTGLKSKYVSERGVTVFEDKHYCHPEWGAMDAPLPPCVPQSMVIRTR